jgi:hypothetical protein
MNCLTIYNTKTQNSRNATKKRFTIMGTRIAELPNCRIAELLHFIVWQFTSLISNGYTFVLFFINNLCNINLFIFTSVNYVKTSNYLNSRKTVFRRR